MGIVLKKENGMIDYINKCFKSDALKQIYQNYNMVWAENNSYPYFNYFGINFNSTGISSVKFYFHIFNKLTKEQVELFLPKTSDFFKYYHLHEHSENCSSDHSGVAFELKFKDDKLTPTYGFHFRLKPVKESYDILGYPKSLPFDVTNLQTRPGVNFEYTNDNLLKKRYYYLEESSQKSFLAKKYGFNFLNDAAFVEHVESEQFSKFNVWGDYVFDHISKLSLFSKNEDQIIAALCNRYGLKKNGFGYYNAKNIRSVYLFDSLIDKFFLSEQKESNNKYLLNTITHVIQGQNSQ
jgi:hypothetical protein